MGKVCCKGSACCGCCCGKRGATITFSLIGIMLAAAVIVPPVYIYTTDQDFNRLFPIIRLAKRFLRQITEDKFGVAEEGAVTTMAAVGGDEGGGRRGGGGADSEGNIPVRFHMQSSS